MVAANSNVFLRLFCALFFAVISFSCTSLPLLVPNPPSGRDQRQSSSGKKDHPTEQKSRTARESSVPSKNERSERAESLDDIDFSLAFADEKTENAVPVKTPPPPIPDVPGLIVVPRTTIRVALKQSVTSLEAYVLGSFELRSPSLETPVAAKGRLTMEARSGDAVSVSLAGDMPFEVALPCTIATLGASSLIGIGQESYRGMLVVTGSSKMTVVNVLPVEEYLRGVVPLELGKTGPDETEALKAQSVAARTYAYNRIVERTGQPFDVVSSIADQVYGGANVETPEADAAIAATKSLVVVYDENIAQVYFHSTCGGRTANMHEVWDKPFCEYLRSVDDRDASGTAYCSQSPRFFWKESWTADQLSRILRVTIKKAYPGSSFNGTLRSIVVGERFFCGRIQTCTLEGTGGENICGGDKIRFVLRRKNAAGYLLRSANFSVTENGPRVFELEGIGYGHGVGMCQFGARGRARQGQTFEQILQAYFPGTRIGRVHPAP